MFWNGLDSLTTGQPADGIVGDEFAVGEWQYCCGRIKTDSAGRLWVLAFEGVHFLDVYQLPLTEYSVPLHTIWKEEAFFPVLGTGEDITLGHGIHGIAPVASGEFLWLSDTDNHRVLRIRDPLINPVVDVVLGQTNASGNQCNQGRFSQAEPSAFGRGENTDLLCFPGALSIDRMGNLYVSDHALEVNGNRRLLVFSQASTPTTNTETIFAPPAKKAFTRSAVGLTNLWADPWERVSVIGPYSADRWGPLSAATWEAAFDSSNRMVVGYNAYVGPRFVGVYDDPLGPDQLPDSFLHDFGSMPYTATFDENDNLFVGDINRGRVLVYRQPFDNPRSTANASPLQEEGPSPSYPLAIRSVSPRPPFCVSRNSNLQYETTLSLEMVGIPDSRDLILEFRKVTSLRREHLRTTGRFSRSDNSWRIDTKEPRFWQRLWPHLDKVTLTVRIIEEGGNATPISNWSPAFLLANDALACGVALPTPTATPTPTSTNTPTPTPSPTPTHTPTPTPQPTPTYTPMPRPLPTPANTSIPRPLLTPTYTSIPNPLPAPTLTSAPAARVEATSPVLGPGAGAEESSEGSNSAIWIVPATIVCILLAVGVFQVWRKRHLIDH